ncbi:hypothetical protein QBC32DRAFT_372464 [Pseudoneurospora amorphoporcata]|uniref:Uncharacterized protein n=1 Tax=Pseudoneurospora amorphoporcata TaxID=241081 RepID=A0AAN6SEC2_9PEZI|nr:hypothetical protein QBC32DRAFT_372464 [Pseudoneurospora amorphoporcata]
MAVSLKLGAGHPSCLGTGGRVWDPACCPDDVAVQGQDSGSLEKLSRGRLAYPRTQSRSAGKHRRSGAGHPIERANRKTDKDFISDYLQPSVSSTLHKSPAAAQPPPKPWTTKWTHPKTGTAYTISLVQSSKLTKEELQACFDLIKETSYDDYQNSKDKWQPRKKMEEMKSPGLRYVLVKEKDESNDGSIRAFTSLMPTYEEGQPVVYCYEIHLKPELQG